jgi:hypothetical protein
MSMAKRRNEHCLQIHEDALRIELLSRLIGRVFHVTTRRAYAGIRRHGSIRSNQDGKLPFVYSQSEASYFRKRGCVSVFDLRAATTEQINEALGKYYFLDPFPDNDRPTFLILGQSCYERLISWRAAFDEEGHGAMVVPCVEAGYPSEIPLSLIDSALLVTIKREPRLQTIRRLMSNHKEGDQISAELFSLIVRSGAGLTKAEERELRRKTDVAAILRQIMPPGC